MTIEVVLNSSSPKSARSLNMAMASQATLLNSTGLGLPQCRRAPDKHQKKSQISIIRPTSIYLVRPKRL